MLKFFRRSQSAPLTHLYRSGMPVPIRRIDQDSAGFATDLFDTNKDGFAEKLFSRLRRSRLSLYKLQDVEHPIIFYDALVVQMQDGSSPSILKNLLGGFTKMKVRKLCFAPNLYLLYGFRNAEQAGHLYNLIEKRRINDDPLVTFAELQYTPTPIEYLIALVYGLEKATVDVSESTYLSTLGLSQLPPEDQTIHGNAIAVIDEGFFGKEALTWPPVDATFSGFFDKYGAFFQQPKNIPQHGHGIMCAELAKQAASRQHLILLANADDDDYAPPIAIAIAIAYSAVHGCLGDKAGGADMIVCSLRDADKRIGEAKQCIRLAVKFANKYGRNRKGTPVFWASADHSTSGEISSLPEVIAIGATDQHGKISIETRGNKKMDFSAPGQAITIGQYTDTGTSYAAPLAAGLAARVLANYPKLSHLELRAILRLSCIKMKAYTYTDGRNDQTGYGLLNYPAALELAGQFDREEEPEYAKVKAMVRRIKEEIGDDAST